MDHSSKRGRSAQASPCGSAVSTFRLPRFVMVDQQAAEDARLSLRTKGLLLWLSAKPDDWEVDVESIAGSVNETQEVVCAAFHELRGAGYLASDDLGWLLLSPRQQTLGARGADSHQPTGVPARVEPWPSWVLDAPHDGPHLYRLYDAAGALLYLGRSRLPRNRVKTHLRTQPWADQISSCAFEHIEGDLDVAERRAIATEAPKHNKAGML